MNRRSILQRGAALALLAASGLAVAADYPTKPITMIVPQATARPLAASSASAAPR